MGVGVTFSLLLLVLWDKVSLLSSGWLSWWWSSCFIPLNARIIGVLAHWAGASFLIPGLSLMISTVWVACLSLTNHGNCEDLLLGLVGRRQCTLASTHPHR